MTDLTQRHDDTEWLLMGPSRPLAMRVTEADTHGHYSVGEQILPPKALVMPHVHSTHDQLKIILRGTCGIYLDGVVTIAPAGTISFGPRGLVHALWNAGTEECVFLELTSPGGFEDYFKDFALIASNLDASPELRAQLGERYGITILPEIAAQLSESYGLSL
ncbi:MAG: cupin protein [Subtercola sp.]|jgi:quercetin dioxygenase-like cupin family protein|nr:cupin protein [Subtercola sp.]